MKSSSAKSPGPIDGQIDADDLRDLVARVTRQVARRMGQPRADLAAIVTAEVTEALGAEVTAARATATGKTATASGNTTPVSAALRAEVCASCLDEQRRKNGRRAVVTTTGRNRKGIVARIAQGIADAGGDILDISQTLVSDYFTMIIIIDTSSLEVPFTELKARLTEMVRGLGAECLVMHEDVVNALQRI